MLFRSLLVAAVAGDQPQSPQESGFTGLLELPTPTSSEIAGIPSPISTPIENVGCSTSGSGAQEPSWRDQLWSPEKWKVKENELRSMHQQQLDTINKIHWDDYNSTEFVRSEEALKTLSDIQNDMLPKAKDLCSNEGINATDTEIRQSLDIVLTDRMELQGHARWSLSLLVP